MSAIYLEGNGRYVYLQTRGQWYVMDSWAPPLGGGAIGIVYLGYNYYSRIPVAIKVIKPEYTDNPFVREHAKSEAQLTFLHPHIVRMLGLCESGNNGPIYILSEYVRGLTFDTYCRDILGCEEFENKLISILKHSVSILGALEYVHKAGVIHRDVKPSNIMVTFDHIPKLMDLGIAGFTNSESLNGKGFTGTALYAAPEQIRGKSIDERTDIYAMGVTMFELLAGYNPFYSESQDAILERHLNEDLPEDYSIPNRLMSILRKATDRKISRRYHSAADFAMKVNSFLDKYVSDSIIIPTRRFSGNKSRR